MRRFAVGSIDVRAELIDATGPNDLAKGTRSFMPGPLSGTAQLHLDRREIVPQLGTKVQLLGLNRVFEAYVVEIEGREGYSTIVTFDVVQDVTPDLPESED